LQKRTIFALVILAVLLTSIVWYGSTISPKSTTTVSPTVTPGPNHVISSTINSTTATYAGTTLVCVWGATMGDTGFIFILNTTSPINIDYLNITNIGTVTAYVSGLRVQAYSSKGTAVMDETIPLDASGVYSSMPTPKYLPFTLPPGQWIIGTGSPFDERATSQEINLVTSHQPFSTYIITPVWSAR